MKKIFLALIIASVILSSGCTDSGAADTANSDNNYMSSDGTIPDRAIDPNRTGMRTPPGDGNFTRPERPEGAPEMPDFTEPTDTEIAEVASIFDSGDMEKITEYCADSDRLCMYYCMNDGRENAACQTILGSIRETRPEMEMADENN